MSAAGWLWARGIAATDVRVGLGASQKDLGSSAAPAIAMERVVCEPAPVVHRGIVLDAKPRVPRRCVTDNGASCALNAVISIPGGKVVEDLRLTGWLVPRVCAVIIRGYGGFSVQAVARWPFALRVNRGRVRRQRLLEDGDELTVAGQLFTFHLAMT